MSLNLSFIRAIMVCAAACTEALLPTPNMANLQETVAPSPIVAQIAPIPRYEPRSESLSLYRLRLELARSQVSFDTASALNRLPAPTLGLS